MSTLEQYPGENSVWHGCRSSSNSPAIMQSLEINKDTYNTENNVNLTMNNNVQIINDINCKNNSNNNSENYKSFLLIDERELLKVSSAEQFIDKLGCCDVNTKVKVISIFGNTGDGKSHTLNQTFFNGNEVFKTSNEQNSCTLGVWSGFDKKLGIICLDTEGLLGITINENERTRLLLKVLAISDIVIYRTRSERLHRDLFTFLGAASRAYTHHFQSALQKIGRREGVTSTTIALGPSVIIYHETRHTRPLINNSIDSPEDILRNRFSQMRLEIDAFSSIKYVGVQTHNPPTDYKPLYLAIKCELDNTTVRSARKIHLVYDTLKILNDKFSGEIENITNVLFPDQYFTCPIKCLSCDCRCKNSMGHLREGKPHYSGTRCRYQHQYENVIYICKKCHANGNEIIVTSRTQTQNEAGWYGLAKFAWAGYVIECPQCGEIYRSRQYWYGNKNPEDAAVRTEITHVFQNNSNLNIKNQNVAQKMIDGVSYISEVVANASLQPTKTITSWVADQVAPNYWRPNNDIKLCFKCKIIFGPCDTKHHCRNCGEGFCTSCSSKTKCVPAKNWFTPVRVCDDCYSHDANDDNNDIIDAMEDVSVRKVSEHVVSTLSAVGTVLTYSKCKINICLFIFYNSQMIYY